jgi:carboxyl-terminal processing protease
MRSWRSLVGLLAIAALSGCGGQGDNAAPLGGGGGSGGGGGGGSGGSIYDPTLFLPAASFANRCQAPRNGIDPFTQQPYPDQQGTYRDENDFLRSWTNDTYLWYDEVTYPNPADYSDPREYFALLKTPATTASGAPKDKYHYWYDTATWNQLSQAGIVAGYGANWYIVRALPPREIVVAYVEPNSPAEQAGLQRGDRVIEVDGESVVTSNNVAVLNEGLFPSNKGVEHEFVILKRDGSTQEAVTLTSEEVVTDPVPVVRNHNGVGYILFNDHIATAEGKLIQAFTTLKTAGVTDLVLDLRYNSGGYLGIAAQIGYMIAGQRSFGEVFEEIKFNDKHPTTDPITGEALEPIPFLPITLGFDASVTPGQALPTLDLSRVYVITTDATCSASESIINALRGIDVEVYQIGSTTCGKPYGFYGQDNCGTTYFTIQFQGNNAKGFGDYPDGFSPANEPGGPTGVGVPGCQVADDFLRDLGDADEAGLAAALQLRASGNQLASCPAPSMLSVERPNRQFAKPGLGPMLEPGMHKSPFHQNRILNGL